MSIATAENGWVNTLDSQNPAAIASAYQILERTIYCTLSTCSPEGQPWVSPVFFAYDSAWNFYWASAMAAKHSQNLYANQGQVAIAVYDTHSEAGKGQGVYLSGTAAEVEVANVESVIPRLTKRSGQNLKRSAADYLAPSPRRLYRFQPEEVWVTGERFPLSETVLMDTKIRLDLAELTTNPR
jgi:nitroimidazol reductase NimA-like FMN-containing flavoprotein (pyridoxamine 5'-phosphate oxidase superfamily)